MGKRKNSEEGEGVPRKKHKKNKHKKKGRIREEGESRVVEAGPGVRPLTLKIKLGKKPVESEVEEEEEEEEEEEASSVGDSAPAEWPEDHEPLFTAEEPATVEEEGSEVEEEAEWLVAMEKGQLDETGYVPRRPGTTLTARQKAMLGSTDEQLLELPLGKARQEMTEDMILKKTEKNRKRRQAAQRRKEKRKVETVRKLLEKQTKKKDEVKMPAGRTLSPAFIHYVRSPVNSSLSLAPGVNFPLPTLRRRPVPVAQECAVSGCSGRRRCRDSVSGLPLCSLACYKTLHSISHSTNKNH